MLQRPEVLPERPPGCGLFARIAANCADRPENTLEYFMDAFSEILSGVKLNGALFFSAEFSAPWCFASPASSTLAPLLAPGAPHLVIYHFVIDGAAFVQTAAGLSMELGPGDVVVLPHGDPHIMTR